MSSKSKDRTPFSEWLMLPQTLVALSALLLSLCGLFIALYEASLTRKAHRASVWPHVEVSVSIDHEGIELWARNTGVGPARIRAAAITYRDETQSDWSELIHGVDENVVKVNAYTSLISGTVLPSASRREVFFAIKPEHGAPQELMARLRQQIFDGFVDVTLCYCSVYDECWVSSLKDVLGRSRDLETVSGPRVVSGCEAAKRSGI